MAAPIHQREQVRLLAIQHGLKKASELSGINYETVRKWSQRGHWNKSVTDSRPVVPLVPIVDHFAAQLDAYKHRSKAALARYSAEASEEAVKIPAKHKLKAARQVRDVAAVHSSLWPEDHNERGLLNVNVLAGNVAVQVNEK